MPTRHCDQRYPRWHSTRHPRVIERPQLRKRGSIAACVAQAKLTTKDGSTSNSRLAWCESGAAPWRDRLSKPCIVRTRDTEHSRNTDPTSSCRPAWRDRERRRAMARPSIGTMWGSAPRHGTLAQYRLHIESPPRLVAPIAVSRCGATECRNRVWPAPGTRNTHATQAPHRISAPPGDTDRGVVIRHDRVSKPCMASTRDTEQSRNTGSTSHFRPAW